MTQIEKMLQDDLTRTQKMSLLKKKELAAIVSLLNDDLDELGCCRQQLSNELANEKESCE